MDFYSSLPAEATSYKSRTAIYLFSIRRYGWKLNYVALIFTESSVSTVGGGGGGLGGMHETKGWPLFCANTERLKIFIPHPVWEKRFRSVFPDDFWLSPFHQNSALLVWRGNSETLRQPKWSFVSLICGPSVAQCDGRYHAHPRRRGAGLSGPDAKNIHWIRTDPRPHSSSHLLMTRLGRWVALSGDCTTASRHGYAFYFSVTKALGDAAPWC